MSELKVVNGMIVTKGAFRKKYTLGDRLGRGKFAEVRKATDVVTHQKVAVKILDKDRMRTQDFRKVYKELEILQKVRHNNVVRVYEAYETDDFFYIVMEYIGGGELFQKIVNTEHFSESKVREIIEIIAKALQYCNTQGVVHRDIKPDNILLTEEEEIKIVDFNLSRHLDDNEAVTFNLLETQCGTPNYVAPEVLSGNPYNFKCDIWSLGVILFVMLSGGYLPFILDPRDGEEKEALLAAVRRGVWSFEPEEAWESVSRDAKSLVLRMMDPNPDTRFDYDQVLSHPFMQTGKKNEKTRAIKMGMNAQIKMKARRKLLTCGLVLDAVAAFSEFVEEQAPPPKKQSDDDSFADA